MKTPQHVAIIMDGNGRWALKRGSHRTLGHVKGARVARKIIRSAAQNGVQFLTLYAFSTENWNRPETEVRFLMSLLKRYLLHEKKSLMAENVRFRCIGDLEKLPKTVVNVIEKTIQDTAQNTGLNLVFALNYGGRQEIVSAIQSLIKDVADGRLDYRHVSENMVARYLDTSFMPDPDLIIRTSGEKRLSNFLLWQSAYSELYFTKKYWPEFTTQDFESALQAYALRDRRFGRTESTKPVGLPEDVADPSPHFASLLFQGQLR